MHYQKRASLLEQLRLLVIEEGFLYEVPVGVIDHFDGEAVKHGLWPLLECSQVLLAWLEAGLIGVYRQAPTTPRTPEEWQHRLARDDEPLLPVGEARSVLQAVDRWLAQAPEGLVHLRITDVGDVAPPAAWWQAAG